MSTFSDTCTTSGPFILFAGIYPGKVFMIDRFEKFSLAISEIYRYWHKIAADVLGEYNLKSSHAVYLTTLNRFPDGLTAPRLAELCGKDKADVSRMLSILEKRGLVVKNGTAPNRYRGTLVLTEEGFKVASRISGKAALAVERANIGISDADRKIFNKCLETIAGNLEKISEEGL